ncbi:MAG TPA: PLP-dependent cysteine synthase family protein [Steroidobacteraceae bacterium]|nr:PLP-dependent cysteine synthase family protein [Steroidobacteraceae bacterium]
MIPNASADEERPIRQPVRAAHRAWIADAVRRIEADFNRSADTHLIRVGLPYYPGIELYLKDESSHPTGSLKHRLARSLFLYALCNGWLGPESPVVEASSGSTAVSEAYFARMLGLRFIAVVPKSTAAEKIAAIAFHGGECHFVDDPMTVHVEAERLARSVAGHFMDQFKYAERATDWRGNNNIAESIFRQLSEEPHPIPRWIVCGAGTGGTSATLGRFVRYKRYATEICVSDPTDSVFHRHFADRRITQIERCDSCIEGIGRRSVEPSFIPEVVDRMIAVSDAQSIAAMREISERLGRRCGGSTGTNVWACARLIGEMAARGESGSVVSILCDPGERYASTYFNDDWLAQRKLDLEQGIAALRAFFLGDRAALAEAE